MNSNWSINQMEHGKRYMSAKEEQYRFEVYQSNKQMIEEHNAKYAAGLVSYELKMNHFGDKVDSRIDK